MYMNFFFLIFLLLHSTGQVQLDSYYYDYYKPGCPEDSLYQSMVLDTNVCYANWAQSYKYVCSDKMAPVGEWYATL
jgi:hypothetical protein